MGVAYIQRLIKKVRKLEQTDQNYALYNAGIYDVLELLEKELDLSL